MVLGDNRVYVAATNAQYSTSRRSILINYLTINLNMLGMQIFLLNQTRFNRLKSWKIIFENLL